ncbi:stress response translation initiation inhibitor YciH [Ignicoccus hospitalis]|uniref:Protein translation factor SUI1 homolog n=1 Tax=Ignicoccus hospitalis (strain KIN4/I / DSM 18386 / JCM 14125) TaxID=453591 RepID=SUI1_IGNH4|nr:stress response translation initiation inhibitor YciH [Ignicoccus hospitalis]A8AC05.1 RecName: Full=Protein translation factor SUI1 homolog [Ignicoccus hospitalis KIN4/I]ABU82457.1 translation initiation factor 1 (eIF-1/SUI1) [Ignicoccus hospitalis KIN4/I]
MGTLDPSVCGGLPPEVCEQLMMDQQELIKIKLEKRKWGREVTIIEGLNLDNERLKKVAKQLKSKLATGGTVKNGRIELQGDHRDRVKKLLEEMGYPPENIVIVG